jgi:hypothetical protein
VYWFVAYEHFVSKCCIGRQHCRLVSASSLTFLAIFGLLLVVAFAKHLIRLSDESWSHGLWSYFTYGLFLESHCKLSQCHRLPLNISLHVQNTVLLSLTSGTHVS